MKKREVSGGGDQKEKVNFFPGDEQKVEIKPRDKDKLITTTTIIMVIMKIIIKTTIDKCNKKRKTIKNMNSNRF